MYNLTNTSLFLWVDLPKQVVLTPDFFAWFAEKLRFDALSIMIDDSDKKVDFSWKPADVEKALELADPYALEIGLTTWPYPIRDQIIAMRIKMDALLSVGPVSEWETDVEFNWSEDEVEGFANLAKAGAYFVQTKNELCLNHEVRNTHTTHSGHREGGPHADVVQHADRVALQVYSIDARNGKPVVWGHRYGPERMQKSGIERALKIPGVKTGKPELAVGLAAWAQRFLVHKDREWKNEDPKIAMHAAFDTTLQYAPRAVGWWSAKYCYPKSHRYNNYSEHYLKSLRKSC